MDASPMRGARGGPSAGLQGKDPPGRKREKRTDSRASVRPPRLSHLPLGPARQPLGRPPAARSGVPPLLRALPLTPADPRPRVRTTVLQTRAHDRRTTVLQTLAHECGPPSCRPPPMTTRLTVLQTPAHNHRTTRVGGRDQQKRLTRATLQINA